MMRMHLKGQLYMNIRTNLKRNPIAYCSCGFRKQCIHGQYYSMINSIKYNMIALMSFVLPLRELLKSFKLLRAILLTL